MILNRFRNAQIGRTLTMALLLFEFSACNNNDVDVDTKQRLVEGKRRKFHKVMEKKVDEAFTFKNESIANKKQSTSLNQKEKQNEVAQLHAKSKSNTENMSAEENDKDENMKNPLYVNKFSKLNRRHYLKVLRHFDAEFQATKSALIELESANIYGEQPTKKRYKKFTYQRSFSQQQINMTQMLGRDPMLTINPTDGPLRWEPNVDANICWNDKTGKCVFGDGGAVLMAVRCEEVLFTLRFLHDA